MSGLPCVVAAHGETGLVVTLDQEAGECEVMREPLRILECRRKMSEPEAQDRFEKVSRRAPSSPL